jgi:hypothetical protein
MTEFSGREYYLRAGGSSGFAIKVQGTTRFSVNYGLPLVGAPASNVWPWGWGGTSDVYFSEGRLSADGASGGSVSIDVQLSFNNESRFGQGLHFENSAFRLGGGRYYIKIDRANRVIFDNIYGESTGISSPEIALTSRTQSAPNGIFSVGDLINASVVSINGTPVPGSGMDLWAWGATRCMTRIRPDGRIFTPNLDLSTNNRTVKIISFENDGLIKFSRDNGTAIIDHLFVSNTVIRPEIASGMNIGTSSFPFDQASFNRINMGGSGPRILFGSGSPQGNIAAPVGSIFLRDDGGASTSFYVKESGTGDAGWVAK